MRGAIRITLSLFDEKISFKTKANLGSDLDDDESYRIVADDLRRELGSHDFPWEVLLKKIDAKKAWSDVTEKFFGDLSGSLR